MRSRIPLLSAALALLLAPALAGCSTDDGVTLEFQTSQAVDSPTYLALETITEAFEDAHPGIHVDLEPGGDDYESQMKVRLAAGDPPDLWSTHGWSLLRYSSFLAPLNDEPWAKDFNPILDPVMTNSDGEFFALPVAAAASGLIVNETVLDEVGVDPDTLTSWDAIAEAAEEVKAAGIVPFELAGSKDGSAGNVIDWLAPGAFTADEFEGFTDGQFPQAAYERLLGELEAWRSDGWVNVDYSSATFDDMARALAEGKTAFALSSNYLISSAWQYDPDADLSFQPVPSLLGGESYLLGGEGTAFGAAASGDHLQEAKQYLAFLAQPENMTALAQSVGSPPGLLGVPVDLGALTPAYDEFVATGDVPLEPFFDRVYLPNGMWETVVSTADGVVAGVSTPADGAARMATDFDTLYQQSH